MRGRAEEADDGGVAVVQLGHGVEEVGDEARAGLHRGSRNFSGGDTKQVMRRRVNAGYVTI